MDVRDVSIPEPQDGELLIRVMKKAQHRSHGKGKTGNIGCRSLADYHHVPLERRRTGTAEALHRHEKPSGLIAHYSLISAGSIWGEWKYAPHTMPLNM